MHMPHQIIHPEERLETIISRSPLSNTGCLEWTGATMRFGYGTCHYNGKQYPVHRIVYMLHHKVDLSFHEYVCHKCDNPKCVNIGHLFLGTPKENRSDCLRKNRHCKNPKKYNYVKNHSNEVIISIKKALSSGKKTGKQIAKEHNVAASYVSRIKSGKRKSLIT